MLRVDQSLLGRDPLPGRRKGLRLRYAIDGKVTEFKALEQTFLLIGADPPPPTTKGFVLMEAWVGAGVTWVDVTDRMRAMIRKNPVLDVRRSALVDRDPVPVVHEFVYLRYAIDGVPRTVVVHEGTFFNLDTRGNAALLPTVFAPG